jgi:small subunit ribosomal protein S2
MGGMLTNFQTIQSRIRRLHELEMRRDRGDFEALPKKEAAKLLDELAKLNRLLGGMRDMARLPSAVFVVDPHREENAVHEARRLEVPIVAMVDTNCNPDVIDRPIPANDDAIRAIRLLTGKIADAILEGRQQREAVLVPEEVEEAEGEAVEPEVIDVAAFSDVEAAMLRAAGEAVDGEEAEPAAEPVVADEPDIEAVLAAIPPLDEDEEGRRARRKPRKRAGEPAGDEEEVD